jgi:hypothetical protein
MVNPGNVLLKAVMRTPMGRQRALSSPELSSTVEVKRYLEV